MMNISLCTTLVSITLSQAFAAGHESAALDLWCLNVSMLHAVPPDTLRRVQLCITVQENEADVMAQVKHTRWKQLVGALSRFPGLTQLVVIIKGDDNWLCDEVWQVVEFPLREVRTTYGIRLQRGQFCIV